MPNIECPNLKVEKVSMVYDASAKKSERWTVTYKVSSKKDCPLDGRKISMTGEKRQAAQRTTKGVLYETIKKFCPSQDN